VDKLVGSLSRWGYLTSNSVELETSDLVWIDISGQRFRMSVQDQSSIRVGQGSLENCFVPKLFVIMARAYQLDPFAGNVWIGVYLWMQSQLNSWRLLLLCPLSSKVLVDQRRGCFER
jgi:hypothetical protein